MIRKPIISFIHFGVIIESSEFAKHGLMVKHSIAANPKIAVDATGASRAVKLEPISTILTNGTIVEVQAKLDGGIGKVPHTGPIAQPVPL